MPQRLEYLWHGTTAVSLNYHDRSRPMNLPFGLGHARVGYFAAADHGGRPEVGLFLKATSSLVGPSHGVVIRHSERRNDHEIELAVVIGKQAEWASEAEALNVVAGYCIGLDMTMRGSEEQSLRKSLDTFTVLGPWMVTADEFAEHLPAQLSLRVNGELRQSASTADLIMSIPQLIAYASRFYTLFPGDVLLTGTPEGVGPVRAGDVMTASIGHIGSMTVEVRADVRRQYV